MGTVIADNFAGSSLSSYWQNGFRAGATAGLAATPSTNAVVSGGQLALTARSTNAGNAYANNPGAYTTGAVSTPAQFGPYGTMTIVAEMSKGNGMHPAMWMVPKTADVPVVNIPANIQGYEIDIIELPQSPSGGQGTDSSHGHFTYHWTPVGGTKQSMTDTPAVADLTAGFHTYQCIWTPGEIVVLLDGTAYLTVTSAEAPICNVPMVLYLTNQIDDSYWGSELIVPDATTPFPTGMTVDSVLFESNPARFFSIGGVRYRP